MLFYVTFPLSVQKLFF